MNKKYNNGICWGVWDMFHIGHLNLIRNAKYHCIDLTVCVSNDEYCLKQKNKKPIIPFEDRYRIVNAIKYVNNTNVQSKDFTKQNAIESYMPEVIFVGSDWKGKDWEGEKLGIPIIYLPYTQNVSSNILRNKLNEDKI